MKRIINYKKEDMKPGYIAFYNNQGKSLWLCRVSNQNEYYDLCRYSMVCSYPIGGKEYKCEFMHKYTEDVKIFILTEDEVMHHILLETI